MRARALVTRVRVSDATSRASSRQPAGLFRPLRFAAATATQFRRRDCIQPARASGAINPTGPAAQPPLASPRHPWSSVGRRSSLTNGVQKH